MERQLVMRHINCSHFCGNKHYTYRQDPRTHNIDILQHQSLTFMINVLDRSATSALRNACCTCGHGYIPSFVFTIPPSFTAVLGYHHILIISNTTSVTGRVKSAYLSEVSEFNLGYWQGTCSHTLVVSEFNRRYWQGTCSHTLVVCCV